MCDYSTLKLILKEMGSQSSEPTIGVIYENRFVLVSSVAAEFGTSFSVARLFRQVNKE